MGDYILTKTSPLPKKLEKWLIEKWKKEVLNVNNFDASTHGCEGTENLKNDDLPPR